MKIGLAPTITALALAAGLHHAAAQGTAFTYQGRLSDGGNPANGRYDLVFSLYTVDSGGAIAEGPLTNSATSVSNGQFTVTLDFGAVFAGQAYWLDISARTNGNGTFIELSPRQPLTATPYSIYSGQAEFATTANGVAGGVVGPNAFQVGAGPAPGQVLSYNGSILAWTTVGGGGGSGWSLTGNSGTVPGTDFLGTLDNQPLELWVNNGKALRLEPGNGSPNIVGGRGSSVDPSVGGATIAGGVGNTISVNSGNSPTIGGGNQNTVSNLYPTVAGGENNQALANGATIGGGFQNTASGRESTIAGGAQNMASGTGATVGGGGYDGVAVTGNTAGGAASVVAGGIGNSTPGIYATVGGGWHNTAALEGFVGGGDSNAASGEDSVVAGGEANVASAWHGTVGGGSNNLASGLSSTVPGGAQNLAQGDYSLAAGNSAEALHQGSFVWADDQGTPFPSTANNQFSVRASGGVRFVTGGAGLTIDGVLVTNGGGGGGGSGWGLTGNAGTDPSVNFMGTTDGASLALRAANAQALLLVPNAGGADVVGGSLNSVASGTAAATISGGTGNKIAANYGTVSGGIQNTNSGLAAAIGGGDRNVAGAAYATVPGGYQNSATGQGSFAAGQSASTTYPGNFIWGDGTRAAVGTGSNRFDVLATGGVNFFVGGGTPSLTALPVTGQTLVGVNTSTPRQPLDVNGGFLEVQGGGAQAGFGGLGSTEVDIGSFNSSVSTVSFVNLSSFAPMSLKCCSITILGGCDLAEPFPISTAKQEIAQGAVVVIDDENPGRLKLSDCPYDTRVAGIVSGANGINPGIQMHQEGVLEGGKNVALSGRVYVQADTSNGAIKAGDLLTSSTIPGHAMKVSDHQKALGAILGKAMSSLKDGTGMILVLVTLQ